MNKNYTVRYRLTIRGILTGDDMKVIAPTKHHAIELVRHLINIDCIQTHFDDVHLDCQVIDETEDPLTIFIKGKENEMSRIPKYQAWHKHLKEMFEVAAIQFREPSFVVKKSVSGVNLETWTLDEVELREFTGLTDRHGKEVYEGDIVHIVKILTTIPTQPFDKRGLITYTAPEFHASGHSLQGYEYEVIGNIYENPELFY